MIITPDPPKPPSGWLALLVALAGNPSAHAAALLGLFMYLQYRLFIEVILPLSQNLVLLTEAVRSLERSLR
jgi:hypothetical protein